MKGIILFVGVALLFVTSFGLYATIYAYELVGYWGIGIGLGWFSMVYVGIFINLLNLSPSVKERDNK